MNLLLQSLASEEWAYVVKALLHTLWLGGLAAGGLYFVIRGRTDPVTRYRWCVGALLAVVFGGMVAWAVLERRPEVVHSSSATIPMEVAAPASAMSASSPAVSAIVTPGPADLTPPGRWTPWLALIWLGGAAVMLARAGSLVMEAEKLRRGSNPLENKAMLQLIEEARRKLGLARRIQVVVTERLTSPAVMGLVTPVLILPLSLVTTLPPGQVQLILLHELAHIRRGDYLVNLCQLLAESLLFFNPAVWWISRQIRQEREACCDAMAIALAGEPLQYARTLAQVAGEALAAAPAFGDRRNPSGLKDRIQRLLVPGYRPALRLTWRALAGSLGLGFVLLTLCAVGTRWTVAAAAQLLTPQQRIDRIEKTMEAYGHPPRADSAEKTTEVSLTLRMKDGGPLPQGLQGGTIFTTGNRSSSGPMWEIGPHFTLPGKFGSGELLICLSGKDIATSYSGPFHINAGPATNFEVVLDAGFPITLRVLDADTGAPIAGAGVEAYFLSVTRNGLDWPVKLKTDEAGEAVLAHGAALPFNVTVNAPGYEKAEQPFEAGAPGEERRIKVRRALPTGGVVLDRTTQRPIAGASIYFLGADMLSPQNKRGYLYPRQLAAALATTDGQGRFALAQIVRNMSYGLLVTATGYGGKVLFGTLAGNTNLQAELGPELRIQGTISGDLSKLETHDGGPAIRYSRYEMFNWASFSGDGFVPVTEEGGVGHFDFTLEEESQVELVCGGATYTRHITGPVDAWEISPVQPNPAHEREVVLRFEHPPGVPPKGAVHLLVSRARRDWGYEEHDVEITNGEARLEVGVGREFSYRPGNMIGYSFADSGMVLVPDGSGPMVIPVPVVPAGAIYVKASYADGSPAGEAGCSVSMFRPPPGIQVGSLNNASRYSQGDGSWLFIQSPVPLGGTYLAVCTWGCSFATSDPIELTDSAPDRRVDLKFDRGVTIEGQVLPPEGRSLESATVALDWNWAGGGWSFPAMAKATPDENGRFHFKEASPSRGAFSLTVTAPGLQTAGVPVDFDKLPLTIQLKAGLRLTGRVLEAKSGLPVISAQVTAQNREGNTWRRETALTDALGNFTFDTLWEGDFQLDVAGADYPGRADKLYKAGQTGPVVLKITLNPNSGLRVAETPNAQ
jgi:beta-lactamase regulating signal transducer with metallopeptidase domain